MQNDGIYNDRNSRHQGGKCNTYIIQDSYVILIDV